MAGYPLPGDCGSLFRGYCDLRLVAGYEGALPHHLGVYPEVFLSSTTKSRVLILPAGPYSCERVFIRHHDI
jgi:hypothetical protein